MKKIILFAIPVLLLVACGAPEEKATVSSEQTEEKVDLSIEDQMYLRKATELAHWSMPWNNFIAMEKGFNKTLGAQLNDVVYYSKPLSWKTVITTPNNTTLYVMSFWNIETSGPIVVEIPATNSTVGLFGTIMDSWQRPLIDVGGMGYDEGKGAKYVVVPEGYEGAIPSDYKKIECKTNKGFFLLRTLLKGFSEENLVAGNKYIQDINVYPLAGASSNPTSKHHDAYDKEINAVSEFTDVYFDQLNDMIQAEDVEERDMVAGGIAEAIGMVKGKEFNPTAHQRELLKKAAKQVQDECKFTLNHPPAPYWENSTWSYLLDPSIAVDTEWSWQYESYLHYRYRSDIYYAAFSSVKKLGDATMYLVNGADAEGNLLKGENDYVLHVPADAPVKQFWSVLCYDLNTAGFVKNTSKAGVSSLDKGLIKNSDGSVDVYFGPNAPEGKEANWAPSVAGVDYFLLFRFYGPTENASNGSWKLSDLTTK